MRYQRIKVCCHGGHEHVAETFEADTAAEMVELVRAVEGRYTTVWVKAETSAPSSAATS